VHSLGPLSDAVLYASVQFQLHLLFFAVTVQSDDGRGTNVMTSSTSKPTGNERLPVILEPPLLVPGGLRNHAPLLRRGAQLLPDSGAADDRMAEVQPGSGKIDEPETGSGITGATEDGRMADEGPAADEEWLWKYDEHGKKIWYRKSETDDVIDEVPVGHAGTVRFATRPMPSVPGTTPRPHGYWMVDDRGAYLWYRFVETGQYVRDPSVETIVEESASPDDQPAAREKLTWTGVGRYDDDNTHLCIVSLHCIVSYPSGEGPAYSGPIR